MARPGDVHGDPEVSNGLLALPGHRLVVRHAHYARLLVRQHVGDELDYSPTSLVGISDESGIAAPRTRAGLVVGCGGLGVEASSKTSQKAGRSAAFCLLGGPKSQFGPNRTVQTFCQR